MIWRVLGLCLMVSPAFGDCLTAADLIRGVRVKLEDGSVWSVRRQAHDVIRIDQTNAKAGYARYVEGPYGVYPTESTRNGQGVISEYSYARTPPKPGAGMDWTSNVRAGSTEIAGAAKPLRREKVHVTAGAAEPVRIGRCTYHVLEIDMGHLGGPHPTVQHFTYFPDLGFGIQTRITYPGDTVRKAAVLALTAE